MACRSSVARAGKADVFLFGPATVLFLLSLALPVGAQEVRLSVMGVDPGVPGGTAAANLVLGNVLQTDVADVFATLRFEPEVLSLDFDNCTINEAIQPSHVLEGAVETDEVQLRVLSNPQPAVLPPAPLVTCVFDVLPGAPAGATSVTFTDARAVDTRGNDVTVVTLEGVILILAGTPIPTPTRTVGPTFTVRSASAPSDCSVVPAGQAHPLGSWLLLGGAALLLIRRRW